MNAAILLQWTAVSGAQSNVIYTGASPGTYTESYAVGAVSRAIIDAPRTTDSYGVIAAIIGGVEGGWSQEFIATPNCQLMAGVF